MSTDSSVGSATEIFIITSDKTSVSKETSILVEVRSSETEDGAETFIPALSLSSFTISISATLNAFIALYNASPDVGSPVTNVIF